MAYLALFRKYRPQTFEEMVGQEAVTTTLQNAIRLGRIAHAYLFAGPRGVGKTTAARILAKCLNCEQGPTVTPCNRCELCLRITRGTAVDIVEIDAASNRGIDDIRNLRDSVRYAPAEGRYKFYILDEAHQITSDAFNALLKTLEEPPPHVIFLMATTEPHRVPATILSRCQRFDFHRVAVAVLVEQLQKVAVQESLQLEREAAYQIARAADGSVRDSLSLLDQLAAYSGDQVRLQDVREVIGLLEADVLFDFGDALANREAGRLFALIGQLLDEGKQPHHLLNELQGHVRALLLARIDPQSSLVQEWSQAHRERLMEQCLRFAPDRLMQVLERLARAERDLRWAPQPRLAIEMVVAELILSSAESAPAPAWGIAQMAKASTHPVGTQQDPEPIVTPSLTRDRPLMPWETQADARPSAGLRLTAQGEPAREGPMSAWSADSPVTIPSAKEGRHDPAETGPPPVTSPLPQLQEVTMDSLRGLWDPLLHTVRLQKMATFSLIRRTIPWRLEGSTLVIAMDPEMPFALDRANQPRHRAVVEEALRQCTQGVVAAVRYEPCHDLQALAREAPRSLVQPLQVQDVLKIFPGSSLLGQDSPPEE